MCAALSAALTPAHSQIAPKPAATTEEVTNLSPFVVTEGTETGYSGQQTLVGSRSAKSLIEIPANITIINKEVLDDLNATVVSQAVRFGVSGVTQNTTISDDFNIRGFRTEQAMRNGVTKNANRTNPMYDVTRIEVIKGPAAMMLGNNSFLGGAVNLVSYQPTSTRSTEAQVTLGEKNYLRGSANTSGPLIDHSDVKINYRFTVGGLRGDREKEVEMLEQKFIGGAFSVYFGSTSSLLVNAYYFRDNSRLYYNDFIDLTSTVNAQINQYSTKSFSPSQRKNNLWDDEDSYIDLQFLTKLSENGNARFYYSGSSIREHRRHVRSIAVAADNYTVSRQDIPFFIEKVNHNLQLDYLHHLQMSGFGLDTTVGVDGATTYSQQQQSVNTPPTIDSRNPDWTADAAFFGQRQPGAGLPHQTDTVNRPLLMSYYFQENLSLLKDRVVLVGGLRWFNPGGTSLNNVTRVVTDRNKKHFKVHKYGIVVKILPTLSAYYTDAQNIFVQTGFADRFVAGDQLGAPAGNQEGKLQEFGIKANHKLSETVTIYGTLAHYDMALTNIKTNGILPSGNPGQIISAQDTSKGWELDYGTRLSYTSGHADLIVTYSDGTSATAANPSLQAVDFAPKKYSVILKNTWSTGPAKGLMLGGAVMDQSAKRNITYMVDYPLTASVFASYSFNKRWSAQFNIDNLTNKRYLVAVVTPGLAATSDPMATRLTVRFRW